MNTFDYDLQPKPSYEIQEEIESHQQSLLERSEQVREEDKEITNEEKKY